MVLFTIAFAGLFLFLTLMLNFARERREAGRRRAGDDHWSEMALGVFENGDPGFSGDRIEQTMRAVLKRLGLGHGIITLNAGESCTVLKLVSAGYGRPKGILPGQSLPRGRVFCGELRQGRAFLAIDFASLSEWRRHPAFRELGWESYIGFRQELGNGDGLTVGFFHSLPREQLFSASEKEFVRQAALWLTGLLEREKGAGTPAAAEELPCGEVLSGPSA